MNINKKDVFWNYTATFFKIGSVAIILPFILNKMESETVAIWSVFMVINTLISLFDLGFSSSFTRTVTYVFSGVKELKTTGFFQVESSNNTIDYGLLKGLITAMQWIYFRVSLILFLFLITFGSYYIYFLLKDYTGNRIEVYISWSLIVLINTYSLFTLYYDSLIQGKGLIKESKQIVILGQVVYLLLAIILINLNFNLIAIVSAQFVSVLIVRVLSYKVFFTKQLRKELSNVIAYPFKKILASIYPNTIKIGLTSLGGFLVQRSAIIIGSLYLTLEEIASYGITIQLITVIALMSGVYTSTFIPLISQYRVEKNIHAIKNIYIKGQIMLLFSYLIMGVVILFYGDSILSVIGSKTQLLPFSILLLALFLSLIEINLSTAGGILLTKNEVPFFKASLISGFLIVLGLFLVLNYSSLGVYSLVLVPILIDLLYQAWKWPWEVMKDLHISFKDYPRTFVTIILNFRKKIHG